MSMLLLPLGSYRLPLPAASCRMLVNSFAEMAAPDRPRGQPIVLRRAPGIAAWGDTEETECRGAVVHAGTLYVCAGDQVFSVSSTGAVTPLTGDPITGNGPVRMTSNGQAFVICPGNGEGFSSDGSTVSQITDPTFTDGAGAADPVFVDGYLVFRRMAESFLFHTEADSLVFDGTFFTDVDGAPDRLVGLLASNREVIAAGADTVERYYNAGTPEGSVFARSPGGFHEIGCAAGGSLCQQDNAPFMLASDRTFRRLGAAWDQVSHPGIDGAVHRFGQVSDCYALTYRQEGHHFVAWTFPNAGRTLVLDLNTGEWHERESRIDTVSIGRWRPAFIIDAYGKQIVGDSQSGKLGILDPDTHEEWGEPQVCSQVFQPVYAEGRSVTHRCFELGIAAGQGTSTGQGANPLCTLHVSDDGGNTFRAKPTRELGKIGEYRRRVRWFALGASRQRVYKVEFSDPVPVMVLDAQVDAEGGRV